MIGHNLKFFRKQRGYTQAHLAELIGVTLTQYQRYEYDTSDPTLSNAITLSKALGVSLDALVNGPSAQYDDDSFSLYELLERDEKEAILRIMELFLKN